ncbi:hypothetical protein [Bradyrhizobium cytisi]|uniref:Uncharacterized protein n=1 Tax=Bradyrhizobium cytisi TaxID=515489 RepID=A0A5S4VZ95_9BRAD|nr:hypothetical protein [Bradyrhizobium cytisi]TYL72413.1 hypothetical protein FXB38_38530 [Bradyrhizobium cytisi]
MVKSPSSIRCHSHTAWSPETAFGLWPPIWPGATLPVSSTRFVQAIAVLIATPNWRERAVAAIESGMSRDEAAKQCQRSS